MNLEKIGRLGTASRQSDFLASPCSPKSKGRVRASCSLAAHSPRIQIDLTAAPPVKRGGTRDPGPSGIANIRSADNAVFSSCRCCTQR